MLGSSALVSFAQYLITRRDSRKEKASDTGKRLDALEADMKTVKRDAEFSRKANHLNTKDRVAYLTAEGVRQGYISVSNLAYVEEAVALLHEDGENGEMTACLESARRLEVR